MTDERRIRAVSKQIQEVLEDDEHSFLDQPGVLVPPGKLAEWKADLDYAVDRKDRPTDLTYRDYRESVETAAEVAVEAMQEYPEDYDTLHDAVRNAIDGSRWVIMYGQMLMTVLLTDQDPEHPDYCSRWQSYVDLTSDDTTWSDCVSQMAWVCHYSDVMDRAIRMIEEDEE